MRTSSWPAFDEAFWAAVFVSSSPVVSLPFWGSTILTFFAAGFDSDYDILVAVDMSTHLTDYAYLGDILGIL